MLAGIGRHRLGQLGRALAALPGLLVLLMMAVTTLDVLGRYFLNRPLTGAFEVTEMAMALVIFAGLGLAARRREHITVNLLETRLGPGGRRVQAVAADLVCAGVTAALAWRVASRGTFLLATGEKLLVTGVPRGAVALAMAALAGGAALAFLAAARAAGRGQPGGPEGATGL